MLGGAPNDFTRDEASQTVTLRIPEQQLESLVDAVAIAKSVVCDGDAVSNVGMRRSTESVEQLVYEQSHDLGGADAIWQDPSDGSYHHPTFPEQQGEAWKALQQYLKQCFTMKLIELGSLILAERHRSSPGGEPGSYECYEHLLMDILEANGVEGLLRTLIAGPDQPYS